MSRIALISLSVCLGITLAGRADRKAERVDPARRRTCPKPEQIEHLHAAAFYFQHRPYDKARDHLRQVVEEGLDATAKQLRKQLSEISTYADRDPDRVAREVEDLRVVLSDWVCLPSDLHHRFHDKLPALR